MKRRRRRVNLFGGASGKIKDKQAKEDWIVQPKYDGQYCEAETDEQGRIIELRSKTGRLITTDEAKDMIGVYAGYGESTLIGELTGHTEIGKLEARKLGWSRMHLFDAVRLEDTFIHDEPYHVRLDKLNMMHAELQAFKGPDKIPTDVRGRAHDFHGRFTRQKPRSWKRTPIVQSVMGHRAKDLWKTYVSLNNGEGLVWCDPNAWLGKRGGKLKDKPMDFLDCTVTAIEGRFCQVSYVDWLNAEVGAPLTCIGRKTLIMNYSERYALSVGDIIEVGYEGINLSSNAPKHPRIVRRRDDLL